MHAEADNILDGQRFIEILQERELNENEKGGVEYAAAYAGHYHERARDDELSGPVERRRVAGHEREHKDHYARRGHVEN